jgi:4-amino-4-deoxy-L-arabinose transferase-like glycosyltransferase
MTDAYHMVIVNVITSCLVFGGVLFYKFIFPKKKINLFVLLLVISILPVISIVRTGVYESGDFNLHIRRAMEFYSLLSQGNVIPTWAGDLNATYGYPLFAFNYILPYYIISLFHFVGLSFVASMKVFLSLNIVFSAVFMYFFTKNHFKNALTAFTISIFYLFAPYHLINVHFRITVGEILAYTLIPLVFYFTQKFINQKRIVYLLLSGLMLGLIILSHIAVAIYLIPAIILYAYITAKTIKETALYSFFIILISLLVACFQWSASLIYYPYLFVSTHPSSYLPYFPTIKDLLYSPWRLGFLFQGPKGELSFLLGYAQVLVVVSLIILLLKKRDGSATKIITLWLTLFFVYIFFVLPYSSFIWKYLPVIKDSGSQRILIPVAFCASLLAGYLATIVKKKWIIYALILLAIGTTILNWGNRRTIPTIDDAILRNDLSLSYQWGDTHIYALPKWVNPEQQWFTKIPKSHLEILSGNGNVEELQRTSTLHIYKINAQTPLKLRENTLYFPGWTATFNGKSVLLEPDGNGVITLSTPNGKGELIMNYQDLLLFQLTKIISFVSIFLICLYVIIYYLKILKQKA